MRRFLLVSTILLTVVGGMAVATPAVASGYVHHVLVVPRDFPTIQAAVDAAAPGDLVEVRRGTYIGEVVIDKDLELRGAGVGVTSIKAPVAMTAYGVHLPDGRDVTAVVRVGNGAAVRMSGLSVTGPIPCAIEVSGVNVVQGASLELAHVRVTGIHADATTCSADDAAGRAVVYGLPPHIVAFGSHGSTAYGSIHDVVIDNYQHAGISVSGPTDGPNSRVQVVGNVVVGGAQLPSLQYGIHIAAGAVVRVADNRVVGNVCNASFCGPDPINEGQGIGILVQSAVVGTSVVDNNVAVNDVGVYQVDSPNCCTIAKNRLNNNRYFGIVIQDGDGAARSNVITGGQVGIGVVADFVDTTADLRHNVISNTSAAPVQALDCCGVTATAHTH